MFFGVVRKALFLGDKDEGDNQPVKAGFVSNAM